MEEGQRVEVRSVHSGTYQPAKIAWVGSSVTGVIFDADPTMIYHIENSRIRPCQPAGAGTQPQQAGVAVREEAK